MFDDIVREMVGLANELTGSLQVTVQHSSRTGQDGYGKPIYAAPVARPAVVSSSEHYVQNAQGQTVLAKHKVTFVGPVAVKSTDRIVLPNGTTGPILDIKGVVDPETGIPYAPTVVLG